MAITFEDKTVTMQAVIYEDEVLELRKQLIELAPEELVFDLSDCDDVHLAVIQQMLAYKMLYKCSFNFSAVPKVYQKIIEGFDASGCKL